mgnify:CR=1 FL=1
MTKKFIKYVFLLSVSFCSMTQVAKAEWSTYSRTEGVKCIDGVYYVLVHDGEENIFTIGNKVFDVCGPCGQIVFDAKRSANGQKELYVAPKVGNNWTEDVFKQNPGNVSETFWGVEKEVSYKSYGPINLDKNATAIKFYTKTGATLYKYFKNIKVTMAEFLGNATKTDIDFGSHQIDKKVGSYTQETITIDWCNISNLQLSGLENTSFSAQIVSIKDAKDNTSLQSVAKGKWGTAEVQITFRHNVSGTHIATLTIAGDNGDIQKIQLHGEISKLNQQIDWAEPWTSEETHTLSLGMKVVKPATATSELDVTYELEDKTQDAIRIADDKMSFFADKATETPVTIIARQSGNEEFNPSESKRSFIVTSKQLLFISWNQDLTRLFVDDEPITLNAKVMVVDDMETGTLREDTERTKSLQYEIDNKDIATIQGNILTPKSQGDATITVTILGDEHYETATVTMPVHIRTATVGCEDRLVLSDNQEIVFFQMNTGEIIGDPIAIDQAHGIPGTLVFMHKREVWKLGIVECTKGPIKAQQSTDGGNNWTDLIEVTPEKGKYTLSTIALSRNATHIRFVRPSGGQGYHYVTNIQVYPAQFIETEQEHDFGTIHVGSKNKYSFKVSYSNIKSSLVLSINDNNTANPNEEAIQLSDYIIKDDCGAWGEKNIDITFIPVSQEENYSSVITIADAVSGLSSKLTLRANISANAQTITWNPKTTLNSVEDLELNAVASSGYTDIDYKVTDHNDVADFDDNGNFVIYKNGEVTITAYQVGNNTYLPAEKSVTFTIQLTPTFYNDGVSNDVRNWNNGRIPTAEDVVLIAADMHIACPLSIAGMTIKEGTTVTVKEGGVLTLGGESSMDNGTGYGNLVIENGGEVVLGEGLLKVNDFGISAKLGGKANDNTDVPAQSGQIANVANLSVNGQAYFELALDPSGQCSYGWYDFTLPFPVDAKSGVWRWENGALRKLIYDTNYRIMDNHEDLHAMGQYDWKKFTGIMLPGTCYTITVDDVHNVYRFYKSDNTPITTHTSTTLQVTEGDDTQKGWNGIGNGTLQYANLSMDGLDKVQIYDHAANKYNSVLAKDYTFVVGSSFFVQVGINGTVMNYQSPTTPRTLRAPKTESTDSKEFVLQILESTYVADVLYLSASDTATYTYQIGHDLLKMGSPADSRVACIWSVAYGHNLCDVELPLANNEATFDLRMFAPVAGEYTLHIPSQPANATLYLMQNGHIVHNLSLDDYTITLPKGVTSDYSLWLQVQPKHITTDVDVMGAAVEPQKVLYHGHLYILYKGHTYTSTGNIIQ